MFAQLHQIRLTGRRVTGAVVLLVALAMLVLSDPAGASTASPKGVATPVALTPNALKHVDASGRKAPHKKAPKKQAKKHALGASRPKQKIAAVAPAANTIATTPASTDLTAFDVPVGDQGDIGSCTTWAIDYAMLG